ncbi:pyridoxamine 5'-phosphate oxidase family protein [Polaribacter sp. R77954]|uniref:pyridoxamine 5'-phosphate oxidase family protein n=1 Tax=Polaribacter sp. R77954 TaxID=3093870 RepID=UPI0037CC3A4C
MKEDILQEIKNELINGYAKRKHPFRYFTLATINNTIPRLRTAVLRKMQPDFTIIVYTDLRSQKVADIQENNMVSGLFYHPKKLLQIKIEGTAEIISDKNALKPYWSSVGENSKKDYTTEKAPATIIKNPEFVSYSAKTNYFCVLKISISKIEYLRLKRPNHIRVNFIKTETGFKGDFLVP